MDVLDQFLGARFGVTFAFGSVGGGGIDRGLVVETVQIAAGLLEVFDPSFRL